jgi:ubiquinone/menaquinone biosynthesis C-methylase UbiE
VLKKTDIYRDSKTWYSGLGTSVASQELLRFCRRSAGKRILDLGCATGDYCLELSKLGYDCKGADINKEYVAAARKKGVDASEAAPGERLPFEDNSFDTVLVFEVLEHVQDPEKLLREAKRVSAGNVLITVPDCGDRAELGGCKLVCEHFLELDHVNFFTKADLSALLAANFPKFTVERGEPILIWNAGLPPWLRRAVSVLYRLGAFRAELFNRLYAVAEKK